MKQCRGAFGIRPRLVARRLEAVNAILERGIIQIGDAAFDRIIEALQAQLRFGGAPVQFRDMLAAPVGSLLPTIEHIGQHIFQPVRIEQPFREMAGDEIV
ncbi:hypothetical protein [Sphingomonas koreensis]|uniref:hypothetical protein n=1 Tax=Sphingomonas koreensis TaxID=93064 RepID=UPI001F49844D|nr:hypothetical protein [Sphingomonas koreensis]